MTCALVTPEPSQDRENILLIRRRRCKGCVTLGYGIIGCCRSHQPTTQNNSGRQKTEREQSGWYEDTHVFEAGNLCEMKPVPGGHVARIHACTKRAYRDSNLLSVDMHTEHLRFVPADS